MNRREALKAVTALSVNGKLLSKTFELKASGKYICFFDAAMLGSKFEKIFTDDNPNTVAYPVSVPKGKTLDEAIRIFDAS